MKNKHEYIKGVLIEQLTKKYLSYNSEDSKYGDKEFKILSKIVASFDFSFFDKRNITLGNRTIRKIFNNEDVGDETLSILVLIAFKDDNAFFDYLKDNFKLDSEFRFVWILFQKYLLETDSNNYKKYDFNEKNYTNVEKLQFIDPLLFVYKNLNENPKYLLIFYVIIYQISIVLLALITNVWDGIDYPLSKSMSVYIGYFFYALSATQLTLFNVEYRNLILLSPIQKNNIFKNYFKYFTLIIAFAISLILHYTFLKDNLHGWCEKEKGVISALGIYHIFIYTFNLWIIFNFIYYYVHFHKIIKSLNLSSHINKTEIIPFVKKILNSLSKLNIVYKNIVISYGCFSVLFFASIINFEIHEPKFNLDLWQIIEIGVFVIFYIMFGFILYWKFFVEVICKFLSTTKKNITSSGLTSIETSNYAISLPKTPNEINKFKSDLRNVIIWIITIIITILIILMTFLHLQ